MVSPGERRAIDWRVIVPGEPPRPKLAASANHASLLAALAVEALAAPSAATADQALRRAIEFARDGIRLERAAIYLVDEAQRAMVGTWGTGARGETVDEHGLMYDLGDIDREVFERAQAGFPWTVYDDCPHVAQGRDETRILGRGWVACTAIYGSRGPLGILFNDTALSRAPLDEAKQARAALLCALLGQVLVRCAEAARSQANSAAVHQGLVPRVAKLLLDDPSLGCQDLARDLKTSPGQLARVFKREAGTSIVAYRNELRLARFLERVEADAHNLLQAALDAGFGSYAQFHRVFRDRFGSAPREYLLERRSSPGQK